MNLETLTLIFSGLAMTGTVVEAFISILAYRKAYKSLEKSKLLGVEIESLSTKITNIMGNNMAGRDNNDINKRDINKPIGIEMSSGAKLIQIYVGENANIDNIKEILKEAQVDPSLERFR